VDVSAVGPFRRLIVSGRGGGPRHLHYDIRFLLEMDDDLTIAGNDESHPVLWVPLHQVACFNNNRSTFRMLETTRRLRHRLAA
jgi:hypothetical protein